MSTAYKKNVCWCDRKSCIEWFSKLQIKVQTSMCYDVENIIIIVFYAATHVILLIKNNNF